MKPGKLMCITAMTLFTLLAIPGQLVGQDPQDHKQKHHHYKLIDVGMFGGPNININPGTVVLNKQGAVVGSADTTTPDPYAPNCFNADCFVSHAFQWQNGILSDLGAPPGGYSSLALAINSRGRFPSSLARAVHIPKQLVLRLPRLPCSTKTCGRLFANKSFIFRAR